MATHLSDLVLALHLAKDEETAAKAERIALEEQIASFLTAPKGYEGAVTKVVEGFKVVVTRKLTRKLDHEAYMSLGIAPDDLFVDYSPKINLKKLREAEDNIPEAVAACITTAPAKVAVKVTEVSK